MEILLVLAGLALVAFVPCVIAAVFIGIAAVFVLIVRRSQELGTPEKLDELSADLQAWSPAAFDDLAAAWEGTYAFALGTFSAAGTGPAIGPGGRALLATALNLRFGKGALLARTAQHRLKLNIADDGVTALVDGRVLGVMRLSTGEIFDELRRPIGDCRRDHGSQLFISGLEIGGAHRSYPLNLHGRSVAKLTTATGRGLLSVPRVPLVTGRAAELTPEESDWLLALCALELGYYAARRSRRALV